MSELKPCPFCGEMPIIHGEESGDYYIECINVGCACLPTSCFYETKEQAIEAWNRREGEQK